MSDQNQSAADKTKNKLDNAVDKIDDALRDRLDALDAPNPEEIKRGLRAKLHNTKHYLKANAKPLALGAVGAVGIIFAGYRAWVSDKDVLVLPNKSAQSMNRNAIAGKGEIRVYEVKEGKFWLMPALDNFAPIDKAEQKPAIDDAQSA